MNQIVERRKISRAEEDHETFKKTLPDQMSALVKMAKDLGLTAELLDEGTPDVTAHFTLPSRIPPSPKKYMLCMQSQEWEVAYLLIQIEEAPSVLQQQAINKVLSSFH